MPAICALLVLRLPIKQISLQIKPILTQISNKLADKLLYISIDPSQASQGKVSKLDLIRVVPHIYKTASSIDPQLDVRILNPIDSTLKYKLSQRPSLVITNNSSDISAGTTSQQTKDKLSEYLKFWFHNSFEQIPIECLINSTIDSAIDSDFESTDNAIQSNEMYDSVAVGGTFDGIHVGHKILFNEATMRCNKTLVVGVTDKCMLKTKILWELIAPVEERMKQVERFLDEIDPGIQADIVPIIDVYGPTIEREQLHYLVVSEETKKGALKVNEARVEKGWQPMEVGVVKLMKSTEGSTKDMMQRLHEKKISSSIVRLSKLGSILTRPEPNPSIPSKPYMIGLTGGVASGKTTVGNYLKSLGFGYINYDLLGHKTYASVDSPVYKQIVDYFGEEILNPETRLIERPKLGKLVFADKSKREKLESWVWPAIHKLVDEEVEKLKTMHDVIVLESALLIESGQNMRVHQIWTTFVPPEEAVRRQISTRNLSREVAERIVNAQLDNRTRILKSNAVFCSLWEPEYTQYQVRKCVEELKKYYLNSN